jgi:hypothetical protein
MVFKSNKNYFIVIKDHLNNIENNIQISERDFKIVPSVKYGYKTIYRNTRHLTPEKKFSMT